MKGNPRLNIVIVGCGRLGARLAARLSHEGHHVIVLDRSASAFQALSPEFSGFRVTGDAARLGALREARMDRADVVFVMTRSDNLNLMVAQVARVLFHVARVLARVVETEREELAAQYLRLGIETICPTSVAVEQFLSAIGPGAASDGRPA